MKAYGRRENRIVEMTFDRFSHIGSQLVERVGFRNDVRPNSTGDKPAFRRLFDNEQDFGLGGHGVILRLTCPD